MNNQLNRSLKAAVWFCLGFVLSGLFVLLTGCATQPVLNPGSSGLTPEKAHSVRSTPLECSVERPTPADTLVDTYFGRAGMDYWEVSTYDTTKDGVPDAVTWTYPGARFPEYYFFDRGTGKELYIIIYKDRLMNGSCRGIEVYYTPAFGEWEEFFPPGQTLIKGV